GSSELAREIVFVDKTANTGELWFKAPSLTSASNGNFYIYYGNSTATEPGAATTYGSQNVWSNGFVAVYHMNAVTNGTASVLDSTSFVNHGTPVGNMNAGFNLVASKLGKAVDFDGLDDSIQINSTYGLGNQNLTISSWANLDSSSEDGPFIKIGGEFDGSGIGLGVGSGTFDNSGNTLLGLFESHRWISTGQSIGTGWHHCIISLNGLTPHFFLDSQNLGSFPGSNAIIPNGRTLIGGYNIGYLRYLDGTIDEVRIANKARNNNWIRTEYNNQNYPNTFYTVNGEESNLNANGFPYKIKITINRSQVNGSVTEFPVYLNLDHMPSHFFSIVKSNGADIRITQSDLVTRVPVEIVSLNKATSNGELWFRASSLSSTANSDFYLWYGNNGATMPSAKSTHGSQNVWSNGFVAVYHMNAVTNGTASVLDSTSSAYHGRPYGNMSTVTSSKMGNSILFDGTNDYINFGTASLANLTSQMYVSAWIYANAYGVWNGIFTRQNASYDGGWGLVQDYTSILASINFNSGLAEYISVANNPPISTWNYLSTRNFSGTRTLFLNSMAEGTSTIIATSSPSEMVAGRFYFNHNSLFFNGRIDEIRVVNKARANNWIKTEYNNQNSPNTFYSITPINNSNIFWGIAP
ncbi:MAG: hypothetical protein LW817_00255, partial [Candidatus Caenarcaniphilales bacterium]|nr:hypothetical protein [Candidatus Caenarcaniphilales bacterium]